MKNEKKASPRKLNTQELEATAGGMASCTAGGLEYSHGFVLGGQRCQNGSWVTA